MKLKKSEDLVLEYLQKKCAEQKKHNPSDGSNGYSAGDIAEALQMQRTNVSALLNKLYHMGKIIKTKGKPVLYALDFSCRGRDRAQQQSNNTFDALIGSSQSLKKCIQQAKAAILYPPHGLHTLIFGPTGAGKTMFAEMMYDFAIANDIYPSSAPFVSFNCADYANNSQLLLAHLFGSKKGAFTGADKDRPGLVEKANGGVLFLDEVHRLPSEGQEMLFYLMDKGLYTSLGDVDNKKRSEVLIICATTEDIDSFLLMTFTRRIPMNISLPALKDRTLEERFALICKFFQIESQRIGKELVVSVNTLRSLLLYSCVGNVGQLKSDIQLGCANAFLNYMAQGNKCIEVHITDFTNQVRRGLVLYKSYVDVVDSLVKPDLKYCFKANKKEEFVKLDDYSLPTSFYEDVEKRIQDLRNRGIEEPDINFVMSFDIENYFRNFIRNFEKEVNKEELAKIVDKDIIVAVENMLKYAGKKLHRIFPTKVFYGLCLHVKSSLERIRQGKAIINHNMESLKEQYPKEYAIALQFVEMIEQRYHIRYPVDEAGFLTMFLSVDETAEQDIDHKPIVVVATHGKSTASSMVEVAERLVEADNLFAYDMPLDKNPQAAYEDIRNLIIQNHRGGGVILLVDMGALHMFGELISEETGIEIQVLDMVSTLIVIECARKSAGNSRLVEICEDIRNNQSLYVNYVTSVTRTMLPHKDHIIITLCTTGEGSAVKLKAMLEDRLDIEKRNIQIIPMAIHDKKQLLTGINRLSREKTIIAIVGTFNPGLYDIPFISIASLFEQDNLSQLRNLIDGVVDTSDLYNRVFAAMSEELEGLELEEYKRLFNQFVSGLQEKLQLTLQPEIIVGLIMHIACAIRRKREPVLPQFPGPRKEKEMLEYEFEITCIRETIQEMDSFYKLNLTQEDIWHITKIVLSI